MHIRLKLPRALAAVVNLLFDAADLRADGVELTLGRIQCLVALAVRDAVFFQRRVEVLLLGMHGLQAHFLLFRCARRGAFASFDIAPLRGHNPAPEFALLGFQGLVALGGPGLTL